MVYTTGDTHSDFTRFTEEQFPIQAFLKQKSNNLLKYQQKLSKTIKNYNFYKGRKNRQPSLITRRS